MTVGIRTIPASTFPESISSIRLHRAVGFEVVGTRRHLGRLSYGTLVGQWRDVLLMERRSSVAGQ